MITSTSNPGVKNVIQLLQKAKARKKQGLFVVEGWKMCREMPQAWLRCVYVSESFYPKIPANVQAAYSQNGLLRVVSGPVFRHMSDTQAPQGILAVGAQPSYRLGQVLCGSHPLAVALAGLQDPGNVGTILRTAEGAGASGILLGKGSADVFSPKTVRATMGSIYRMPFTYEDDLAAALMGLKEEGYAIYAAGMDGSEIYTEQDYTGKTVLLIGNEGNGLAPALRDMADCTIQIPMKGKTESLNAAVAAGILLYEAARQRRADNPYKS